MKFLLSKVGLAFFITYIVIGIFVRLSEVNSDPWMFRNLGSALMSLPAFVPIAFVLNVVGYDKSLIDLDSMLPLLMFLSAIVFYFVGAALEGFIRFASR